MSGRTTWERHPADTARFVLATAITVFSIVIVRTVPDSVRSFSSDLVRLFDRLPDGATKAIIGILQVAAIVAPIGAILWLRRGRWTEVVLAIGSAIAAGAAAALLNAWLELAVPPEIIADLTRPSWIIGAAFPSNAYLAATAAAVTTIAPTLTTSWRRTIWTVVGVVAVARVLTAVEAPLNLVATVSIGVAVGSAALMIFGAPSRRPNLASITRALAKGGRLVPDLTGFTGHTSHGPAYAGTASGERLFVKVVGRDERNADLLTRLVRVLRVKGVEDDRPISPLPTVEHEALNALMAQRAGADVPTVLAVGETDERGAFIALDFVEGDRLADLADEAFTDDLLETCFRQLAAMHRNRIAHLWPSTRHLIRRADGSVCLIDHRWAELSATDTQLGRDLAEMLASLAFRAGAERTVAAAARSFDERALAATLPYLQPLALSPDTRKLAKAEREVIPAVRTAAQERAGVEKFEMAALRRVTIKGFVSFLALLFLGNVLLLFVANLSDIWAAMKDADYSAVPLMIVFMLISFFGGTFSLMGAVNIRLPLLRTYIIMFAQSFLNRFIPANAGGMALRMRYLQRNGVDLVVAAGSVGLTSAVSGVAQVFTVIFFLTWAGRGEDADGAFSFPDLPWLLIILLILVVVGIILTTAFGKKLLEQLRIQVSKLWGELRVLAKRPTKMLMLFGGAEFGKIIGIVMLWQSLNAFHVTGISFAQLGAMYVIATTVAGAVPVPGGVGPLEAALTAGLVSLGVDPATAAAVVVFFRLISYWLPILPCWLAYRYVERHDLA
ncbi:MAG: lysylphosphatidylglycerol synthase domain-containing protein [Ilumatobacteraceae bacterium]